MDQLVQHQKTINDQLARYGVKFGLYKNGTFQERLFPFDPLPRVITAQEFETLNKGLVQRVNALNLFLKDVYGDKKIIRDGIVPEDFVFAGSGYKRLSFLSSQLSYSESTRTFSTIFFTSSGASIMQQGRWTSSGKKMA